MIPTNDYNLLSIHLDNKQIFRGNIKYLGFNIDYQDDEKAQAIAASVEEAIYRFSQQ